MNLRIEKLKELFRENNVDGMIVENPKNIKYLTNLDDDGILIINKSENVFITYSMFIEDVNNKITLDDEIIVAEYSNLNEQDYFDFFDDCNRVYFEENYITYSKYNEMIRKFRIKEAVESNNIIEKLREIKDDEEIENVEKACNITDECFLFLQDYMKVGMTEKQVATKILEFFLENGADGLAFDTIVASGKNTSIPHSKPTDKVIEEGDAVLIDFGAKVNGYSSDMTRTFFMGDVSEENAKLYDLVLYAQKNALEKMINNADANLIAKGVENIFNANNFTLIHALGHGVGLDIHEKPIISTRRKEFLKENMIVTDEPGIYIPGKIGIRIEDTVLINNMSQTVLTKSNKNLMII